MQKIDFLDPYKGYGKILKNVPPGLLYVPTITNLHLRDEEDFIVDRHSMSRVPPGLQMSEEDLEVIARSIPEGDIISMEIGVNSTTNVGTSTSILIGRSKHYIGVDALDRSIVYSWFKEKSIKILECSSSEFEKVSDAIEEAGGVLDLLLIDGDHSINMTINDWNYSCYVKPGGFIIMHDTNLHPGPRLLLDAIDPTLYEKRRYLAGPEDWGIAVVKKL